jgi:hypothetical protein
LTANEQCKNGGTPTGQPVSAPSILPSAGRQNARQDPFVGLIIRLFEGLFYKLTYLILNINSVHVFLFFTFAIFYGELTYEFHI